MATEFQMPKLGLTMEAGTIISWHVPDGAAVEQGTPVLAIETDKVETDVEASASGRLHQTAAPGETFPCGAPIGWFLAEGEEAPEAAPARPPGAVPGAPAAGAPAVEARAAGTVAPSRVPGGRLLSSPNARRVAGELGVDLAGVAGSGPGGRIVSEDVQRFVDALPAQVAGSGPAAAATIAARRLADLLGVDISAVPRTGPDPRVTRDDVALHVRQQLAGAGPAPASTPSGQAPSRRRSGARARPSGSGAALPPPSQTPMGVVPMRGMRRTIASRMHESLHDMAQLTLTMDAAMDRVVADRRRRQVDGAAPSYTDYVIAAAAAALVDHPIVNSQITDDGIALLPDVNVGMAVALDDGLVVPVVRGADRRSITDISVETERLAAAARSRSLGLDDFQGATFTVTAMGMYGVDAFTPIINPPNTAILGVGRIRRDVDWDGDDRPVPRPTLTLSLTWDHRAFDGAPAAEFTRTVREVLESWGGAVTDPAPISLTFAEAVTLDNSDRVALLGGKGAALVRMTELGLPVPPGFVLTTAACRRVLDRDWPTALDGELAAGILWIEQQLDRRLGDPESPLLVSVRSGAPVSMPGMMDTVLNVGMTDAVAGALSESSGIGSFGWDTTRRFIQSYAAVVAGAPTELVDRLSVQCLGPDEGRQLPTRELALAARRLREEFEAAGCSIPEDPAVQIRQAARAVFASWNSDRAKVYRRVEGIADDLGTAVTVQAMTFGNLGERSGTGVAFSRDPSTGEQAMVGEFLPAAQGEDVVSGSHATRSLAEMRTLWPEAAGELAAAATLLERDIGDIADIEFTVEDGVLWLLQVRPGKRSPRAALRAAIDMAEDPDFGLDRAGALARVEEILADPPTAPAPESPEAVVEVLAEGLAASPGRAVGVVCTGIDESLARTGRGEPVILIRRETSPADVAGMAEARGLVTALGGIVSHAAVVARSWGIPAVVGAAAIEVSVDGIVVDGRHVAAGETVTVDGDNGLLLGGAHPGSRMELEEVRVLRAWSAELEQPAGSRAAPEAEDGPEMDLAEVRRVVGLKGVASAESLVAVLGCGPGQAAAAIAALVDEGAAQELPGGRVRLTPDALASVDELFRHDAARLGTVVEAVMDDFHAVNGAFKELVTSWQMRVVDGTEVVNDHTDDAYDAEVILRLRDDIHPRVLAVVEQVAGAEPRLARYTERLGAALEAVQQGDAQMMAHPLRDSYHTAWFELHEELIRLCGRDRASEAAAGRA